jgi:hypothetical protein
VGRYESRITINIPKKAKGHQQQAIGVYIGGNNIIAKIADTIRCLTGRRIMVGQKRGVDKPLVRRLPHIIPWSKGDEARLHYNHSLQPT